MCRLRRMWWTALLLDYLMTDNKDNIKENLMKILTHELVHAVTAEILNYHPSWAKIKNFNEAQTEFSNNVWNIYLQCKEHRFLCHIYKLYFSNQQHFCDSFDQLHLQNERL